VPLPLGLAPEAVMFIAPEVLPNSPDCYANAHSNRINKFKALIQADNQSQDDMWTRRHELDHDVFWLLLYWAMVAQPEGSRGEYIDSSSWTLLLGNFKKRETFILGLRSDTQTDNLTHSVYAPLWPLIRDLAAILMVDGHWLPESDIRKCPEYTCEAFQRLILQFIISHRDEDFMTRRVGDSLRQVEGVAQSQALTIAPTQQRGGLERENERRHGTEVVCVCAIFEFLSFLSLCSQDEDDYESSRMIE
jgi:hypothetical protein